MTTISRAVAAAAALAVAPFVSAECLQDQYGNQFNITLDTTYKSISGVATMVQRSGEQWTISGSYIGGGRFRVQQLTMADSQSSNTLYMLKGTYPNFAWYYGGVYGEQEGAWAACGAAAAPQGTVGGVNR
jgi:hypothetical protein